MKNFNKGIDSFQETQAREGIMTLMSNRSDSAFSESDMVTYVGKYCDEKGLCQTKNSLAFAKDKHEGQYRKPGHIGERIPYICHPLILTCHALALGIEEDDLLSACLLHDVCEDCGVQVNELPVNEETKEAVRLLTKSEDFGKTDAEYRAYYGGIAGNRIAVIVKLLDRCNNISDMACSDSFTERHMAEYIRETIEYIYPLMEKVDNEYPEYHNQLFLIRYHMRSVIESLRHRIKSVL